MKKVFILVFAFAVLSVGSIYAYNGRGHYQGNRSGYNSSNEYGYNNGGRGNRNRGNHNGGCGYNY